MRGANLALASQVVVALVACFIAVAVEAAEQRQHLRAEARTRAHSHLHAHHRLHRRAQAHTHAHADGNPIRKVVTMLQSMSKKVLAEGKREKALYDKFSCYCQTAGGDLTSAIAKAEDKLQTLPTAIEEANAKLKAVEEELKKAQIDRMEAKATMAQAKGIREKDAKAYDTIKNQYDANIEAVKKAVAAVQAGMKGGFLQTGAAQTLRKLVAESESMGDDDREALSSFLAVSAGSDASSPSSGQIVGILKQLLDTMVKQRADAKSSEDTAVKDYNGLTAAKTKEVEILTKAIETKTKKIGDLGIEVVQMEEDLDDTSKGSKEDKKILKDLEKTCATKKDEFDTACKTRMEEIVAIGDAIKILNDDDALELFKKTLPGPGAMSLLQTQATREHIRRSAREAIRRGSHKSRSIIHARRPGSRNSRVHIDLIGIALNGKKVDFNKVTSMLDKMVTMLKKEQKDDDDEKAYCLKEFDTSEDKKKALEKSEKDAEAAIASTTKAIASLKDDIADLEKGIVELDKEVSEATAQRKLENKEFEELKASDSAAKQLLLVAKNRLNKFYNPNLYKSPPKKEVSFQERITKSLALFNQLQKNDAGNYRKKSEESSGVIAMIDLLIAEMDKEMVEAKAEEKNSQEDYERMLADSKEKRKEDSKSLTEKEGTKADMETELETQKGVKKDVFAELYATHKYIHSLHTQCDFLLDFYDVRKKARDGEIKSMADAKAVLGGADYSFLQIRQ